MGDFTKNLNSRVLNKGPVSGYCVICGNKGKLTRDHVPPKKCNNFSDFVLEKSFPAEGNIRQHTTISQGGTHYRTLCKTCNSELLGIEFDTELVKLTNEITSLALSVKNETIQLPETIYSFVKPQRLARSIIGHMLTALAVDETKKGLNSSPISDAMRSYFLDTSLPLPEKMEIYYWLYPSKKQVITKGFGKSIDGRGTIVGNVMKFLPLGFWLVWDKPDNIKINLNHLVPDKTMKLNEVHQMSISLNTVHSLDFPEAPADNEIVMLHSDYAVTGIPKNKKN